MRCNAHRRVRKMIRQKLVNIDPVEPNELTLLDVEADCRELGLEEYGTKMGMEFESIAALSDSEEGRIEYEKWLQEERRK